MKKTLLSRYPLGNPRRLWQQDYFIFSSFSPGLLSLEDESLESEEKMRRSVKTCRDAGFNLLELGWASPRRGYEAVRMCQQLGIGVVYQNLKKYGGMGKDKIFCETNDLVGAMDEIGKFKSVVGYYLWDEPHTVEQMHTTREMMDTCQRKDPKTLPFTVALPSYSKTCLWENGDYPRYIDHYLDIIDPPIMSFDYYPVGKRIRFAETGRMVHVGREDQEVQLDEVFLWCDLEYVRRAAKKRKIPFWFYYQGENLHNDPAFTFDMTRLMMHGALLYGVKGLQNYTAWGPVVDPETGGKGMYFEEQKEIHRQLSQIGGTLMALECDRVIHDEALLPNCEFYKALKTPMEESELLCGTLPFRTSVSELSDAYGNRYLMVLNRDYAAEKSISLRLKSPSRVYEVSKDDGEQYVVSENTESITVTLKAGDMVLYRIQPAEEEAFCIEYLLEV